MVKKEIKRAIKAGVPERELVVIEINPGNEHEVEWVEDHEFRFRGSMYDVIRKVTCADAVKFYCIDDKQESALFANLERLTGMVNSGNRNDRECSVFLFALLTHIVLDEVDCVQFETHEECDFSFHYSWHQPGDFVPGFYSPPEFF